MWKNEVHIFRGLLFYLFPIRKVELKEMASLGFNLGFSFSGVKNRQVSVNGRARVISCCSSSSSEASQQGISTTKPPPEIELEFFGVTIGAILSSSYDPILVWKLFIGLCNLQPKPGSDGTYPRDKAKAVSGEKLLRSIMQDSKIELYATYVSLTLLSLLLMQVFEMSLLFRGKWWTVEVEEAVELALLRQVNFIYLFFCFWIIWFDLWL